MDETFSAEEIHDTAVVCEHGEDLMPTTPTNRPDQPTPARAKSRVGLLVVGVLVLVLGAYILMRVRGREAAPSAAVTETLPPPPAPPAAPLSPSPLAITVANTKPIEVKAQTWVDIYFTLPALACTLTGRVAGVSGGQKDFEAFVMDDATYRTWSSSDLARGDASQTWGAASGRLAVWSPNVKLQGPGTFHLVVSNLFSLTTDKVLTVKAGVNCPNVAQ